MSICRAFVAPDPHIWRKGGNIGDKVLDFPANFCVM